MNPLLVDQIIRAALIEDIGPGDATAALLPEYNHKVSAQFVAKSSGVLCGLAVAERCFRLYDTACAFDSTLQDGAELPPGSFARVEALALNLLSVERVALNFLQRLSGIATLARQLARRAEPCGIRIVETRKTTPGLRMLEKHAVRTGSGYNHRYDLSDAVMLKDNHFALVGGDPAELVRRARAQASHAQVVIAEAGSTDMVEPLVRAGADVVLFDNFTPGQVRNAVAIARSTPRPQGGRVTIEVSGGIDAANLDSYLIEGVDVISSGALTHSAPALDISLELEAH